MSGSPQPLRRRRNTAKLLARLNPKGIGIPTGGGRGTAEVETAIDIAAALGAIGWGGAGPRLAALVLCLRWWPGVFEGPRQVVAYRDVRRTQTFKRLAIELDPAAGKAWVKRDARGRAQWEQGETNYTERVAIEAPAETESFRTVASLIASRLRIRLERNLTTKPEDIAARVLAYGFLHAWSRAVIEEYRRPNQCQVCLGYGEQMKIVEGQGGKPKAEISVCEHCGGGGVLAWSVKRRGKAMRIGEHTFRDYLNTHHDGALALLRELEYRGARLLLRRLGISDER